MRWSVDFGWLIRSLVRGEDVSRDIDAEIDFHLESRAELLEASGMSRAEAALEARRRFGDVNRIRRECRRIGERRIREDRRAAVKDVLRSDLRYVLRSLRKRPGFVLVVTITLALGIGANTAIFSVLRGVVLRPLPYAEPDRLAALWLEFRSEDGATQREIVASEPEYLEYAAANRSFTHVAGFWTGAANVGGGAEPLRVPSAAVSANFFELLRVTPQIGRGFLPGEDRPGAHPVVLVSDGLWRRAFGEAASLVGRSVTVNGVSATVVGVLPASFRFPSGDIDLIRLNVIDPANPGGRSSHYLSMIGRLHPGVSFQEARAEITALTERWTTDFPERHGPSTHHPLVVESLHERLVGDVRPQMYVLSGAVLLVLLIAGVNVASLMLARSEARHREMGVRAALGAGRGRLTSQVLTESGALALLGGVFGVIIAYFGVRLLIAVGPSTLPRLDTIRIDWVVLAFAAGVTMIAGVLAGWLPALAASRNDPVATFHGSGQNATPSTGRLAVRRALVVGEVGLAVVLLIGAGLLIKSFNRLTQVDPGFRTDGVVVMDFALPSASYPESDDIVRFHNELDEAVLAVPGVKHAGAIRQLPLRGSVGWETLTLTGAIGGPDSPEQTYWNAQYQIASPRYFAALGVRLLAGRYTTAADHALGPPVTVINETMARRYWGSRDPIGERIQVGYFPNNPNPQMTIVGVVADVLHDGLDGEKVPQFFVPRSQAGAIYNGFATRFATYVVSATTDPLLTINAVRTAIRQLDPTLPVANVRTMQQVVARSVADRQFTSLLMGAFSGLALLLGAVGIYGLMAYAVARRNREIGLRMALGAKRDGVLWLVVRQGLSLTAMGLTCGLAVAVLGSRAMQGLVFDISVRDPIVFAVAPLLLAPVALAATYVPARRAAAVDPMEAIRME